MSQVELRHGAATDVGRVRAVNEDALLTAPPVFVVADGMGGHQGGDVASRIVVEEFGRLADEGYDPELGAEAVAATLRSCQQRIEEYAAEQRGAGAGEFHAGTTAVVALLVEDRAEAKWLLANLGDSRIYRFAGDRLDQVSVDHSVVQELVDAGTITEEEAASHPARNVITRALGGPEGTEPDYFLLPLAEVGRLLLCSDGVTGMLDDAEIEQILRDSPGPGEAAESLVAAAVHAGGQDNATAVVVDVVGVTSGDEYDAEAGRATLQQKLGSLP
jgi:PPM family protein phosphatase